MALSVFVDTSALYAVLDDNDEFHAAAVSGVESLAPGTMITHNYVVLEASVLAQKRLGQPACRVLIEELVPTLNVFWVDELAHTRAASALAAQTSRGISLVDLVSFEVMRRLSIDQAFTFDSDFTRNGFDVIPGSSI